MLYYRTNNRRYMRNLWYLNIVNSDASEPHYIIRPGNKKSNATINANLFVFRQEIYTFMWSGSRKLAAYLDLWGIEDSSPLDRPVKVYDGVALMEELSDRDIAYCYWVTYGYCTFKCVKPSVSNSWRKFLF